MVVFVETVTLNLEEFNGYLVAFVHVSLFLAVLNTSRYLKMRWINVTHHEAIVMTGTEITQNDGYKTASKLK